MNKKCFNSFVFWFQCTVFYTLSQKSSHLLTVCNFVESYPISKVFPLVESVRNLLQNSDDITHPTLGLLLHYRGKLKFQIFCRYWRKSKQIAFLIASTFVIHPQTLIFSVIKIVNVSPYWLQIKFFMSLFFYLFTLAISLWCQKFPSPQMRRCSVVNYQHDIKQRGQDFDKKFVFERVHSEDVDRWIFWERLEKAWCL